MIAPAPSSFDHWTAVNRAFSQQAVHYDEDDSANPILQWMRMRVRGHVEKFLKPGARILELNAGTGIDAIYFAQNGFFVHATDLSDGMINKAEEKVKKSGLQDRITIEKRSFTDLASLKAAPFDHVFSNFGGLNCISDLTVVTSELPRLLKPGGYITWVIMPRFSPWEFFEIFRGNLKLAFRRWKKKGSPARIDGHDFTCFYFSPKDVLKALGRSFRCVKLEGLSSVSPPPHKMDFYRKHPGFNRFLFGWDSMVSRYWPFNAWADHFILTARYAQ